MAFTAVNINGTVERTHPKDPDPANPTKFIFGFVDVDIKAMLDDKLAVSSVYDAVTGGVMKKVNFAETRLWWLRFGLRGVENLPDAAGQPIAFKTRKYPRGGVEYDIADDSVINAIRPEIRDWAADKIREINAFSEEEAKN